MAKIEVLQENKNKRGEVKRKVVRLTSDKKKGVLHFEDMNKQYISLLKKYKPEQITTKAMPVDGGVITLKAKSYTGTTSKYTDEEYFSSLPDQPQRKTKNTYKDNDDIKDRLTGIFYSVDIIIDL